MWTDDYLAAFAQASNAMLTTLDRKMPARYPSVRGRTAARLTLSGGDSALGRARHRNRHRGQGHRDRPREGPPRYACSVD
jgi:hypothetical protein